MDFIGAHQVGGSHPALVAVRVRWPLPPRPAPPPLPRPGTWICCTMVRSCTRNSLASLALSDNPFSAWESWLCGEKAGKPELRSHRARRGYFKAIGSQTQEPLACPESSCLGLGGGWMDSGTRQVVRPWAPEQVPSLKQQMLLATGVKSLTS